MQLVGLPGGCSNVVHAVRVAELVQLHVQRRRHLHWIVSGKSVCELSVHTNSAPATVGVKTKGIVDNKKTDMEMRVRAHRALKPLHLQAFDLHSSRSQSLVSFLTSPQGIFRRSMNE